ncbi:hypothetical protein Tco_1328681 [Tanacetum coccineum]
MYSILATGGVRVTIGMQSWWFDARRRGSAFSLLRSGAFCHHDHSMPRISSLPAFMVHVDVDWCMTITVGVTMPLGLKEVATSLLTRVCVAAADNDIDSKRSQSTVKSFGFHYIERSFQDVADSCRIGVATNVIFGLALGWKSVIICSFCSSTDTTEGRMKDTESSTLHVVMKFGEIRSLSLPYKLNRMALLISLCKVFTLRSVPLETYLPDGDIDLSAFSNNPSLKTHGPGRSFIEDRGKERKCIILWKRSSPHSSGSMLSNEQKHLSFVDPKYFASEV